MVVTLVIRDESAFGGHVNQELVLDLMPELLKFIGVRLQELDPDHHIYTVKREH